MERRFRFHRIADHFTIVVECCRNAVEGRQVRDTGRAVWDVPVRLTHWLLVLTVSGSWFTSEFPERFFRWHQYCGYAVLLLVGFRLIWGLVGTHYARFAEFVRGPAEVLRHARKLASGARGVAGAGHNPLGGWSVVAMLCLLLAQAATGLFANDDVSHTGPFFGLVSQSVSNSLTSCHHAIFSMLEVLIGVHVAAILYYVFVRRETLVLPMITGRKPDAEVGACAEIHGSKAGLALAIIALLAAALAFAIKAAPEASLSPF